MSRLGKKLKAHGWEKEFDYNYIKYRKDDMLLTYSDSMKDYYRLTSLDVTQMVACAPWWLSSKHQLINNRLIISERHKFFELFMRARNLEHAYRIMDNYKMEEMINKTL